jgi:hypothetical protein
MNASADGEGGVGMGLKNVSDYTQTRSQRHNGENGEKRM